MYGLKEKIPLSPRLNEMRFYKSYIQFHWWQKNPQTIGTRIGSCLFESYHPWRMVEYIRERPHLGVILPSFYNSHKRRKSCLASQVVRPVHQVLPLQGPVAFLPLLKSSKEFTTQAFYIVIWSVWEEIKERRMPSCASSSKGVSRKLRLGPGRWTWRNRKQEIAKQCVDSFLPVDLARRGCDIISLECALEWRLLLLSFSFLYE